MKNLIRNILWTMFFTVFCPVYLVFESLKYVFLGKNIGGRLVIIASYAGVILLALFKPFGFWIVIGIIALCDLAIAIFMSKSATSQTNESGSENRNQRSTSGYKNPFFDGMTVEEAKKEYRRLMKQYHPDNINGDAEMSKRVSAAYSQFCAVYGR